MSRDHSQFFLLAGADGITPASPTTQANGVDLSATSDFYLCPVYAGDSVITGIAFSTTAGGGTVTVQGSRDLTKVQNRGAQYPDAGLVTWFDLVATDPTTGLPYAGAPVAFSGSSKIAFDLINHGNRWLRLRVTVSGGTVTPTATIQQKRP